jgi:hypothetical protein
VILATAWGMLVGVDIGSVMILLDHMCVVLLLRKESTHRVISAGIAYCG